MLDMCVNSSLITDEVIQIHPNIVRNHNVTLDFYFDNSFDLIVDRFSDDVILHYYNFFAYSSISVESKQMFDYLFNNQLFSQLSIFNTTGDRFEKIEKFISDEQIMNLNGYISKTEFINKTYYDMIIGRFDNIELLNNTFLHYIFSEHLTHMWAGFNSRLKDIYPHLLEFVILNYTPNEEDIEHYKKFLSFCIINDHVIVVEKTKLIEQYNLTFDLI